MDGRGEGEGGFESWTEPLRQTSDALGPSCSSFVLPVISFSEVLIGGAVDGVSASTARPQTEPRERIQVSQA